MTTSENALRIATKGRLIEVIAPRLVQFLGRFTWLVGLIKLQTKGCSSDVSSSKLYD
jgi:hypothetical protein